MLMIMLSVTRIMKLRSVVMVMITNMTVMVVMITNMMVMVAMMMSKEEKS